MSITNNIYNILSKLNSLTESAKPAETAAETVYESVEPRGSITEAVKSLEAKFATFKEAKAKPDFLDVDKDGNKAEPFKKAVKDKKAVEEGAGPYTLDDPKHPKFKANFEKYKKAHPDCTLAEFVAAMRKKEKGLAEGQSVSRKSADFTTWVLQQGDKFKDFTKNPDIYAAAQKAYKAAQKTMSEGIDDLTDLDAYQFADPDTDTAVKPATAKQAAAERRRRLQDLEDKKAEKDDWFSGNDKEPNVRVHRAKYQDEPELDEATTATGGEVTKVGNVTTHKGKKYGGEEDRGIEYNVKKDLWDLKRPGKVIDVGDDEDLDEVAPPGAKAERMVKHIKKGYSQDGNLTKKEKGIAYATAWKAKKAGNLEEATEFGDTIKNSAATMKKAKLAKLKESRVMEETDYFYEKVGKALAGKNPNLDTAGSDFVGAVRKEMIAQGIEPNRARGIILTDEDFISDVATSYGHYCKEMQPEGVLPNAPLDDSARELDEIASLAGLSAPMEMAPAYNVTAQDKEDERRLEHYNELISAGVDPDDAEVMAFNDEELNEAQGVTVNGKEISVGSIEVEGVNSWDSPDFADAYITYAEFMDGTPLSDDELVQLEQEHGDLVNQAAHDSLQGAGDFLDEEDVAEGNEFSGALAAAKAKGEKEFEVDGKRYTVKEDINVSITANGQEDALNLFRKLAGMEEVKAQPVVHAVEMPQDLESALAQGAIEPVEEERDIEYVNTPNEKIAPISASIPNGTDLHRSKMQDPETANKAANPLRKEQQVEENLWKSYESMLADVKAK